MTSKRLPLLLFLAIALGALLWLDNRGSKETDETGAKDAPTSDRLPEPDRAASSVRSIVETGAGDGFLPANQLAAIDLEQLDHTVNRPLFAPSRRRPPPPKIVQSPAPAEKAPPAVKSNPPSFALLGVIVAEGRAIALLEDKKNRRSFRVEAGDMLSGWRVSSVKPKSVLLEYRDGRSQMMHVFQE